MSWNVQGQHFRHGPIIDFLKILPFIKQQQPVVVCLQEMTEAAKKLGLGSLSGYQVFIPSRNLASVRAYGSNHNVILSKYPLVKCRDIMLPKNLVPQDAVAEAVSYAAVNIAGRTIHIYNCHFPIIDAGPKSRLKILKYLFLQAPDNGEPVIICGDFNVTIVKPGMSRRLIQWWHREHNQELYFDGKFLTTDERFAFNGLAEANGYKEAFNLNTPTWSPFYTKLWELFGLKLDWLMYKNLEVMQAKMGPYISDHKPLMVTIKI